MPMPKRLDDLYHCFYKPQELTELKSSIEENHKILIENLSEGDRKMVLRIIDAEEMICNYQSKASFIQGFMLGVELITELQNYYDHSCEKKNLNDHGHFFMPKGEHDEKENQS
ncbi:MAG: hypothetical protein VB047_06630 [Anaerotignum propionicum]|uniref:DUF6809 family protein n=1 Tax=Anaerotignum propionicum TaxID=28446 RepID=UPI002B203AD4|nr:DUF6809 family protein [Anaerotignum propionicum]MEA5057217.1 hypothetical protein [Anaerotignum propionicum]